jgi:hypothetical protein
MFVTHHAHKEPPIGYCPASSSSSGLNTTPIPWPAPGIVHLFPDRPICDIPTSYTAGKHFMYVSDVGWVERGTYQYPQPAPNPTSRSISSQLGADYHTDDWWLFFWWSLYPSGSLDISGGDSPTRLQELGGLDGYFETYTTTCTLAYFCCRSRVSRRISYCTMLDWMYP